MAMALSSWRLILALVLVSGIACGNRDAPDFHGSTRTRIAVIGDFGSAGANEEAVANLVKSWTPDFVITTGDNTYSTDIDVNIGQYYQEYIHPYSGAFGAGAATNRFFSSLGNHDWDQVIDCDMDTCTGAYLDYFAFPGNERYYTVTLGALELFVVDSDVREPDGTTAASIQADWLRGRLSASVAPWKVVCFHHPPFASGNGQGPEMRWPFKEWGASAVLSGHVHVYERLLKEGFPYFVNGVGGRSLHPFVDPPDPDSQMRFNAKFGAMLIEVDHQQLRFQFFSIAGGGTLIDTYSIQRAGVQPANRGSIEAVFR